MSNGVLAQRVGRYVDLNGAERAALAAFDTPPRAFSRGGMLPRERGSAIFWVVNSGWVAGMRGLPDGSRQITRIHLPGDVIGFVAPAAGVMETLAALTDCQVMAVPRTSLTRLFVEHPRIAAVLYQLGQVEQVSLGDRIAAIGRTDARARLAGLLLDLRDRQRAIDPGITDTLPLPLTQEEIGDATGLTAVHVNRMMRSLAEAGLIERRAGVVRLLDEPTLVRMSGYCDRWTTIEQDWLPAARPE